jgi:hypothetical protein
MFGLTDRVSAIPETSLLTKATGGSIGGTRSDETPEPRQTPRAHKEKCAD